MSTELQLKEFTKGVGEFEEEQKEQAVDIKPPEEISEEEDLRVEHLKRIP